MEIVKALLMDISRLSVFWIIIGVPLSLIFLFLKSKAKDEVHKKRYKKLIKWSLGGIGVFIATLVLFFIVSFISAYFGI